METMNPYGTFLMTRLAKKECGGGFQQAADVQVIKGLAAWLPCG
jgi:hypothetical protein